MKHTKTVLFLIIFLNLFSMSRLSADLPVLSATDDAAIRQRMGERAAVEGVVTNIFWVRNQTLLITFQEQRGGFVGVSFARHRDELNAAFEGDIVQHLRGKKIQITGEISEHEYRPQIVVRSPDQIKLR